MTVFCCTVCGSDMVCVLYNVMMVKMPVTWIVQQHSHMPALSLFKHVCPLCVLDPSLPDLSSCCNKLFCVKLYCTVGVSWVLVSRRLACIASILWAMQIIVFLTDVPCIFHIRAWLWAMGKKFCFFFSLPASPAATAPYSVSHLHTPSTVTSCLSLYTHISSLYHWNQWNWFSWG